MMEEPMFQPDRQTLCKKRNKEDTRITIQNLKELLVLATQKKSIAVRKNNFCILSQQCQFIVCFKTRTKFCSMSFYLPWEFLWWAKLACLCLFAKYNLVFLVCLLFTPSERSLLWVFRFMVIIFHFLFLYFSSAEKKYFYPWWGVSVYSFISFNISVSVHILFLFLFKFLFTFLIVKNGWRLFIPSEKSGVGWECVSSVPLPHNPPC